MAFKRGARRRKKGLNASLVRRAGRPVVVAALPLKPPARDHLSRLLGDVDLRDVRDDVCDADLVLAPSCSPQVIGALKHAYPSARLVVVELEDWVFDVDFPGPVKRVVDAGADGYLVAASIEDLTYQLRRASEGLPLEMAGHARKELVEGSVDDAILAGVTQMLQRRAQYVTLADQEG